jgi:hypothetical protein
MAGAVWDPLPGHNVDGRSPSAFRTGSSGPTSSSPELGGGLQGRRSRTFGRNAWNGGVRIGPEPGPSVESKARPGISRAGAPRCGGSFGPGTVAFEQLTGFAAITTKPMRTLVPVPGEVSPRSVSDLTKCPGADRPGVRTSRRCRSTWARTSPWDEVPSGRPGFGSRSAFAWAFPWGGCLGAGALGFWPGVGAGARRRDRRLGAGCLRGRPGFGSRSAFAWASLVGGVLWGGCPGVLASRRCRSTSARSSPRGGVPSSGFVESDAWVVESFRAVCRVRSCRSVRILRESRSFRSGSHREAGLRSAVGGAGSTAGRARRDTNGGTAFSTRGTFPALRRSAKLGRVAEARCSGERRTSASRAGSWAPSVHHPAATSQLKSFWEERLFTADSSPLDQGRTRPVGGEPHLRGEPRGWRNGARVCASSPRGLCRGIGPWRSVPKGEPPGVVGKLVPVAVWVPPPGKGRGR